MDITQRDIELLKNKKNRLLKELKDSKQELESLKKPKSDRKTINELFFNERTTQKIFPLEENKIRKVNNALRLDTYELVSGIQVEDISFSYYPIKNKEGQTVETSFNKFEVDAQVNRAKFHVTYVSDQTLQDCYEDKIQTYQIKSLKIVMNKQIHQHELNDALQYFNKNPNLGLALYCIKEYERLYSIRAAILKLLAEQNAGFLKCNLLLDENEKVQLRMHVSSETRNYVIIAWSIIWNKNWMTVRDKFEYDIAYKDEEFLQSVSSNLNKLTKENTAKIFVRNIEDESIRKKTKDSNTLGEEKKLSILTNIILAAKAAE